MNKGIHDLSPTRTPQSAGKKVIGTSSRIGVKHGLSMIPGLRGESF
jgi:hypothetical protein